MWKAIFFIVLSILGFLVIAESCNPGRCEKFAPRLQFSGPADFFPDVSQMEELCPYLVATIECVFDEFKTCTMEDILNELETDNKTIAAVLNIFSAVGELVLDLCDSSTAIHKAYVENVECMKKVMDSRKLGLCALEAETVYGGYKMESDVEEEKKSECMLAAHIFACISNEIFQDCEEEARATFVNIMKRSKVFKYSICSPEEIADLKTKYINFLSLEGERHSIFEDAFDLKKKK